MDTALSKIHYGPRKNSPVFPWICGCEQPVCRGGMKSGRSCCTAQIQAGLFAIDFELGGIYALDAIYFAGEILDVIDGVLVC